MASRKEEKEQRRREREEAERQEKQAQMRRRRARRYGVVLLGVAAAAVAGGLAYLETRDDAEEAFAAKPEGLETRMQKAGLAFGTDHFHPTVRVVVEGKPIPIPVNVGSGTGGAMAPIHLHEGDEKLHAEGVVEGRFTLGQFMSVWGVELTPTRLGPYREDSRRKVTVMVKPKGKEKFDEVRDPASLEMKEGDEVYVIYGTPQQSPIIL